MPIDRPGYSTWMLKRVRDTLLRDEAVMAYLNDEPRRIYHEESDNPPAGMSDDAPIVGVSMVSPNSSYEGAGMGVAGTYQVQVGVAASSRWYKSNPEESLLNLADIITDNLSRGAGPRVIPLGVPGGSDAQSGSGGDAGLAGHTHVTRRFRFGVTGI